MPFTQQYIHIIFATKHRQRVIRPEKAREVYNCIYTLCKTKQIFVVRIGGFVDHIHLLIDLPPRLALADVVQYIKGASSHYIRTNHLLDGWMGWNDGYAAFTIPFKHIGEVKDYIANQVTHHSTMSLYDEYKSLLMEQHIPTDVIDYP